MPAPPQIEIVAGQTGPGTVRVHWQGPIPDGEGGTAGVSLRWGTGAWHELKGNAEVPANDPLVRGIEVTGLLIGPVTFQGVAFRGVLGAVADDGFGPLSPPVTVEVVEWVEPVPPVVPEPPAPPAPGPTDPLVVTTHTGTATTSDGERWDVRSIGFPWPFDDTRIFFGRRHKEPTP